MYFRKMLIGIATILTLSAIVIAESHSSNNNYSLHIDRKDRKLYVIDSDNKVIHQAQCGVGRGGLKVKRHMSDYVTPTGTFVVDIIMYDDGRFNAVSPTIVDRYGRSKEYSRFVSSDDGLIDLFKRMSGIDFDGDGKSDQAYGIGYIGLDSKTSVTGPKMGMYRKTPYWYSIAVHGTPNSKNIGRANSGGCVHLGEKDLEYLIGNGIVRVGTVVTIGDEGPKE